jgi:hypothetical protein
MRYRLPSKLLVSGLLLVVGCLDGSDLAVGHATGAITSLPDLIESTVGDPPAAAVLGGTFTASDTVTNQGTADAGASFTKYYLTSNGTSASYLLGERAVGAITAGSTDSGSATVTIPGAVPEGSYQVLACADAGSGTGGMVSQVDESDETNNCTASAGSVMISGPNLIESNVTASPAMFDLSTSTLTVADTVQNIGTGSAAASVSRWWLSTDAVKDPNDAFIRNCTNGGPIPGRNVGAIGGGASDSGQSTTTPLCVRDAAGLHPPAPGTYYVIVCADATNLVAETNEGDQCATSSNTIQVGGGGGVDLIESAVGNPPATGSIGTMFPFTDTVQNVGAGFSPATSTKFYLSTDGTQLNVYLNTRSVGALTSMATDSATTTMTILTGTPSGTYYVVACADSGPGTGGRFSEVDETNENNNCTASSTTIMIGTGGLPDLTITAVSAPPASGKAGDTFTVTDTTNNSGGDAGSFFNKYYLSTNQFPGGVIAYLATGSAGALPAGTSEMVTATATIPYGITPGTYWVIGCADAGPGNGGRFSQIDESDENNNCTASATTIIVGTGVGGSLPDLVISTVSAPPATGTAGDTFSITDTTSNIGAGDAGTFFNKYYLSSNGLPGGIIAYLATGSAGALTAGTSEMVTVTASIPSGITPGTYWLVDCADAGPSNSGKFSQIDESDENNNCTSSATQITIN